jgi:hypothetical protein
VVTQYPNPAVTSSGQENGTPFIYLMSDAIHRILIRVICTRFVVHSVADGVAVRVGGFGEGALRGRGTEAPDSRVRLSGVKDEPGLTYLCIIYML